MAYAEGKNLRIQLNSFNKAITKTKMANSKRIIIAQQSISGNIDENIIALQETIKQASKMSPDLIVFPEYTLSGTPDRLPSGDHTQLAGMIHHCLGQIEQASCDGGISLILPTLHYDEGWRNSAFVISPEHGVTHRYDKCILTPQERQSIVPGTIVEPFPLLGTMSGILLCSDGNGPELFSLLSFSGARIIFHLSYPDALPGVWPDALTDPWEVSLGALFPLRSRIRAWSMQVHIVSVVPAGCGSLSRAIDPWGNQIVSAQSQEPELITVDIDPEGSAFRLTPTFERRRMVFMNSLRQIQERSSSTDGSQ